MLVSYRKAVKEDAALMADIYNSAFYEDYVRYGECPGYGRTKEEMESSIMTSPKYVIMSDGIPVGAISVKNRGEGDYYIGCLCVIPAYQGMGIGTQAMRYILSICPDWEKFTLVTPADKEKNIKFYTQNADSVLGRGSWTER